MAGSAERVREKDMNYRSGKHFSSVREFYEATRPENIDALCRILHEATDPKDAEKGIYPESGGEWISWKRSLPDFAELLCEQSAYGERTAEEGRRLERALGSEIELLRSLMDSAELKALRSGAAFAGIAEGKGLESVRKAVNKASVSSLSSLESSFEMLGGRGLPALISSLEEQRDAIARMSEALENENRIDVIPPAEVDLEYELPSPDGDLRKTKRIDVLLSRPDKNRFAIIELKQWTEDRINVNVFEGDDGQPDCLVSAGSGIRTQPHPAVKVRDVYKPLLQAQRGADALIRCFVYLHDQMYGDSELFKVRYRGIDICDHVPETVNILYTRLWYRKLILAICRTLS